MFAAGFVMVTSKLDPPPKATFAGTNDMLIDGGAKTLMLADAVPPVPPSVEVTFPVMLF